jgi:hypothetical protein
VDLGDTRLIEISDDGIAPCVIQELDLRVADPTKRLEQIFVDRDKTPAMLPHAD